MVGIFVGVFVRGADVVVAGVVKLNPEFASDRVGKGVFVSDLEAGSSSPVTGRDSGPVQPKIKDVKTRIENITWDFMITSSFEEKPSLYTR